MADSGRVPLELTYVVYDASSYTSLALALLTLSPVLLMPAYTALAIVTRELTIANMCAGQLFCEAFNWFLKRMFKEERPDGSDLNGYGFPSSHSQWMGYFGAFLICHIYFRHRFASCGSPLLDQVFRSILYLGITLWCTLVTYSRVNLLYHTPHQALWGFGIGINFGVMYYVLTQLLPYSRPQSVFGRARAAILAHPLVVWMQIRDRWAIWADGGMEMEWKHWKMEYGAAQKRAR